MKLLLVVLLLSIFGLSAAQTEVPVIGTVPVVLEYSIEAGSITFPLMAPTATYTTGSYLNIYSNGPFKVQTSATSGGFMQSVLHDPPIRMKEPMYCLMDDQDEFPLSAPEVWDFTGATYIGKHKKMPVNFNQHVSMADQALASGDSYSITVSFTLSPI